jgi:hypothetical protein
LKYALDGTGRPGSAAMRYRGLKQRSKWSPSQDFDAASAKWQMFLLWPGARISASEGERGHEQTDRIYRSRAGERPGAVGGTGLAVSTGPMRGGVITGRYTSAARDGSHAPVLQAAGTA